MLFRILMGGIALIGLSSVTSLWQFYFFCTFTGLANLCAGPLPNQVLTSRWFTKSRGKAMSIAYLGIGVGGMLVPQIARWLNINFGWHQALIILGILMIVLAFPMAWFVKENPEGYARSTKPVQQDIPLKNILIGRAFYLLLIGSMCSIGAVSGTIQNLKLFFSLDLGFSQERSANVISLVLMSSIVGRLLIGWLADRFPKRVVMILVSVIIAASIPLLYFPSVPGIIYLFAFIFGVGLGGDYMVIPLMAADLFGVKVLGRVMGIVLTADGLSDAFAPMLIGWLRDKSGSYAHSFAVSILLALIAIISISMLPRKKKMV
jgi:sugar phosphate permease